MEFTWNKERKKFVSPTGQILQGKDVLQILNEMLVVVQHAGYAYQTLDSIFGGVYGDSDSGDMGHEGEVGEVDSEGAVESLGGRDAGE